MKQKGFAPILVLVGILVIIAVAGGAYYVSKIINTPPDIVPVITPTPKPIVSMQPTSLPDETANWKIYTAADKSFSISFPSSWIICDMEHSYSVNNTADLPRAHKVFDCDTTKIYPESKTLLRIYNPKTMTDYRDFQTSQAGKDIKIPTDQLVIKETNGTQVVKAYKDEIKQLQLPAHAPGAGKITTINGLQAVESIDLGGSGPSFSISNGKDEVVIIDMFGSETTNQILSTFKFTQ